MKICIMEDLHLPYHTGALQYEALAFYIEDIKKSGADLLVVPGDFTADGNRETAERFFSVLSALSLPSIVMTGNADFRNASAKEYFRSVTAAPLHKFGNHTLLTLRDGEGTVSPEDLALLDGADENTLVFLHHPISALAEPARSVLSAFAAAHPALPILVGHAHIDKREGNILYLNAADPDKAIGEEPCIYYYDTEEKSLSKTHFPCPIPEDLKNYIGISAFRPLPDLLYAAEQGLYAVEFRPSVITEDIKALEDGVRRFREAGGRCISFHFPNLAERDGSLAEADALLRFVSLARALSADRITVHAPSVPLRLIESDPSLLPRIADLAAAVISSLPLTVCVGVENMHMTAKDTAKDRCFGYAPEECRLFINMLRKRMPKRAIGFHFDTGHARNNMPLSQVYTQSVWMAELGSEITGYHIHQVLLEDGKFVNHYPITEPYGALISYAAFFRSFAAGRIKKAPIFLEIRPTEEDPAPYKRSLFWILK